jgi:predicted ribosomally synthesized peptide with SipW-like signal peptide
MNKKILLGIMTIGLVSMLAGAGLYAYFSDTETSVGNVFTAGTIDISIDPTVGQKVTLNGFVDLKPCQTGYTTTKITNVGPNSATLWKHITNVENREHGITDAEDKYYAVNPDSENWLISNWIHYDMFVWKPLEYSFEGTSETYNFYKPNGINVSITVESTDCQITWTFDFPIDEDPSNGNMGYSLVISNDGAKPEFQVHNNDGTDGTYPWGTHLYSEWGPAGTGYNGWHTGDTNTPVSDLDWITCTGHRYKEGKTDDPTSNPEGTFTVTIDKCKLTGTIYWAAHFGAGGFSNYGGLSKYPDAWVPWSGDSNNNEVAPIKTLIKQITEADGWDLTGADGVASKWINLGTLEPGECMCVIQSYHLDATVDNWGQSDRVFFDIEFLAQQTEGSPPPPGPVLGE